MLLIFVGQPFLLIYVDAHFGKRAQWQKKPNNMKNVEKENNKVKTIGPEWQK